MSPAAMAAGALVAGAAHAESINITNNGGKGSFSGSTYTYNLELTFENSIQTGDFWTLYDFQGLSNVTLSGGLASNWVVTQPYVTAGVVVGNQPVEDDPNLPNIVLTYVGSSPIVASPNNVALGSVIATTSMTTFTPNTVDSYVGQDHTSPSLLFPNGTIDQNHGNAFVPFDANGPFLPLPASAWGGMALFGVLGSVRLKRRLASAA